MPISRTWFIVGLVCLTGCTTGRLRQRTSNSVPAIDRSPLGAKFDRKIERIQEDLAKIRPG